MLKSPFSFIDDCLTDLCSFVMCQLYVNFDISPKRHVELLLAILSGAAGVAFFAGAVIGVVRSEITPSELLAPLVMGGVWVVASNIHLKRFQRLGNKYDRMTYADLLVDAQFNKEDTVQRRARFCVLVMVAISSFAPFDQERFVVSAVLIPLICWQVGLAICLVFLRAAEPPAPGDGNRNRQFSLSRRFAM